MLRILKYLIGMILIALAIRLEVNAKVGVAALDIIQANLGYLLKSTVGVGIMIFSGVMLIIALLIKKNWQPLWTIIPLIVVSIVTDAVDPLVRLIFNDLLWVRIIEFTISLIFMAFGAALMIVSKYPPTPYDNLVVTITNATDRPIAWVRLRLEIVFVILGALLAYLSGNLWTTFNIGTFIYAVVTSYLLQFFVKKLERSSHGNQQIGNQ